MGRGLGAIFNTVGDFFNGSQRFRPRRDPLILDLDGDGIETVAPNSTNPILFDHDGDGVKNGSGWVSADDGFLVLDRNGNAQIDNGTELFGDATPLYVGGLAADGFAALAQEDSNNDGKVDAADARWANLRVWQDANQNGLSEAGELKTLASLGIASIAVAATTHSQTLANGNQVADLGTYLKTNGSLGATATVSNLADINLAVDTFQRQFPDHISVTTQAAALPDMQGSGALRDLREAASQSTSLAAILAQYAAAPTRAAQFALIDQLLDAWADTAGLKETLEERSSQYRFRYMAFGAVRRTDHLTPGDTGGSGVPDLDATGVENPADLLNPHLDAAYKTLIDAWNRKIHLLEAFNGRYFFALPEASGETHTGLAAVDGISERTTGKYYAEAGGIKTLLISYTQGQLNLLDQSLKALRASVYDALVVQTRFAGLLDQIDVVIDGDAIRFDFTAVNQTFQNRIAANVTQGISDLIEFNKYAGPMLQGTGWGGFLLMENLIRTLPASPELQAVYAELGVSIQGAIGFTGKGTQDSDVILGGDTANSLYGGAGNDTLFGGADNDTLNSASAMPSFVPSRVMSSPITFGQLTWNMLLDSVSAPQRVNLLPQSNNFNTR
jgi:hypothetical protein